MLHALSTHAILYYYYYFTLLILYATNTTNTTNTTVHFAMFSMKSIMLKCIYLIIVWSKANIEKNTKFLTACNIIAEFSSNSYCNINFFVWIA